MDLKSLDVKPLLAAIEVVAQQHRTELENVVQALCRSVREGADALKALPMRG